MLIKQSLADYELLDLGDHHHLGEVLDGVVPPQPIVDPEHVLTLPYSPHLILLAHAHCHTLNKFYQTSIITP